MKKLHEGSAVGVFFFGGCGYDQGYTGDYKVYAIYLYKQGGYGQAIGADENGQEHDDQSGGYGTKVEIL